MDITPQTMQYIESVIAAADAVSIDSIIIEPGRVRGMTDSAEVFILHTTKVPDLEFNAVGINNTSVFTSRYNFARSPSTKYTANTHTIPVADSTEPFMFVRGIKMQNKKVEVDCRCANPITIRAPKKILDTMSYVVDNVSEWIDPLARGYQAMGEDLVKIKLSEGTLSFELADSNGDKFKYVIAEDVVDTKLDEEASDEFEFGYHVKVLLPILKKMSGTKLYITSNGMMKTSVLNFDVYLKPVV